MRKRQNFKDNDNWETRLSFSITDKTQKYIDKTTLPECIPFYIPICIILEIIQVTTIYSGRTAKQ